MPSIRLALAVAALVAIALVVLGGPAVADRGQGAAVTTGTPTAPSANGSSSPNTTRTTARTTTPPPTTIPCPSFRGAAGSMCEPPTSPPPATTSVPPPCPEYRGVGGTLCQPTRTPTDTGVSVVPASGDGWLASALPFVALFAAVVLAPVVLGGLLGLDSLRYGSE